MMADEALFIVLDSKKDKGKESHIGTCGPIASLLTSEFFLNTTGHGNNQARLLLQKFKGVSSDGWIQTLAYSPVRNPRQL
jgi:hypothetical protein